MKKYSIQVLSAILLTLSLTACSVNEQSKMMSFPQQVKIENEQIVHSKPDCSDYNCDNKEHLHQHHQMFDETHQFNGNGDKNQNNSSSCGKTNSNNGKHHKKSHQHNRTKDCKCCN